MNPRRHVCLRAVTAFAATIAAGAGALGDRFDDRVALAVAADGAAQPDLTRRLDATVRNATLGQFWGAVLVVRDGQTLLAEGYGLANQDGLPIDRHSLFELASVTKPFTAALIMRLDRAGALSIDDPIAKHLSRVPEDKQSITIRHLLTHTSGLGPPQDRPPEDNRAAAEWAYLSPPLSTPPGTAYQYSNVGYMLLAAIVERVTEKPFEEALREHLLGPAGMRDAGTCGEKRVDRSRAVTRAMSGPPGARDVLIKGGALDWPYPDRWAYVGCGGLVASLDDLLAFDRALRGDALFDAATRKAIFSPGIGGYGFGWDISGGALGRVAEHTGGVAGFRTILRRCLDRDLLVVVLTNDRNDPIGIANQLMETLEPRLIKRAEATLRLAGLGGKEPWSRELPPTAEISAAKVGAADADKAAPQQGADAAPLTVRLSVRDPAVKAHAIAVDLSVAAAAELAGQLDVALASIDGAHALEDRVEAMPSVRAEIYPSAYPDEPDVIRIAGRPLHVRAIPKTMHPQPGDEHRVSIVLEDPTRSFMPVFIELGRMPARRLVEELRAGCAE